MSRTKTSTNHRVPARPSNRPFKIALLASIATGLSLGLPFVHGEPPKGSQPLRSRILRGVFGRDNPVSRPENASSKSTSPSLRSTTKDRESGNNSTDTVGSEELSSKDKDAGDSFVSVQKEQESTGQGKTQVSASKIDKSSSITGSNQELTGGPISVATFDEKNQVIAPDWKDPWAVLFVTGRQTGYMEPCGCTGLENQKGGLMRRDSLLMQLQKRGWSVLPVDAGNQVHADHLNRQAEIKFEWTDKALKTMGYSAATFGEDDLNLTFDSLLYALINSPITADGKPNPLFVSANVSIEKDSDTPFKILTVGKRRIGITAVLGDENASKVINAGEGITITPAIPALQEVTKKLKAEKCDFTILIAHATLEESRAIALKVPDYPLIITTGGYGEPTYRPETIKGTNSQMIQVGVKGMYVGLVGLFENDQEPIRYQRVALSAQFEDSPRMSELFGKYQDQLKAEGFERLGLGNVAHPTGREFVGSEKCGECHTTAFDIWSNTPHAHATDSIVEPPQRTLARHFDPECLSCHTTGWNPQKFFPYSSGFKSLDSTPHLVANGCENCHGPGKDHADAESGDVQTDKETLARLRIEMQLPFSKAEEKCLECHDVDNSPNFHKADAFKEYWEKVKHYGKD